MGDHWAQSSNRSHLRMVVRVLPYLVWIHYSRPKVLCPPTKGVHRLLDSSWDLPTSHHNARGLFLETIHFPLPLDNTLPYSARLWSGGRAAALRRQGSTQRAFPHAAPVPQRSTKWQAAARVGGAALQFG